MCALICMECFDVCIFISVWVCSDDDSNTGKPQIAMDEDLSTPEEEEEEVEEAPPTAPSISTISKPSPAPQTNRPSVVLKSAKDIELTESEEEDDTPNIIADEDIEEGSAPAAPLTAKKTKDVLSGELFEVEPSAEKKKKPPKSSGLMLQFNLPPTPPQPKKTASEKDKGSPKDTPDQSETRRDSKGKKKKSKKSRHTKEEEAEVTKLDGGSGHGVAQVPTIAANDPFGPISALDAWLNSDSADPMVCCDG